MSDAENKFITVSSITSEGRFTIDDEEVQAVRFIHDAGAAHDEEVQLASAVRAHVEMLIRADRVLPFKCTHMSSGPTAKLFIQRVFGTMHPDVQIWMVRDGTLEKAYCISSGVSYVGTVDILYTAEGEYQSLVPVDDLGQLE